MGASGAARHVGRALLAERLAVREAAGVAALALALLPSIAHTWHAERERARDGGKSRDR